MKAILAIPLLAFISGCAISEKQLQALGPGVKTACFHVRCDAMLCGGPWSTTTSASAATDGKAPAVGERCEIGKQ